MYLSGIEIRNYFNGFLPVVCSNCTLVELKLGITLIGYYQLCRSNCTLVELKFGSEVVDADASEF